MSQRLELYRFDAVDRCQPLDAGRDSVALAAWPAGGQCLVVTPPRALAAAHRSAFALPLRGLRLAGGPSTLELAVHSESPGAVVTLGVTDELGRPRGEVALGAVDFVGAGPCRGALAGDSASRDVLVLYQLLIDWPAGATPLALYALSAAGDVEIVPAGVA